MTLLHYDLDGVGSVLGHAFEDHFLEAPEELVEEICRNPFWRRASEEEVAERAEEKLAAKPARGKRGKAATE